MMMRVLSVEMPTLDDEESSSCIFDKIFRVYTHLYGGISRGDLPILTLRSIRNLKLLLWLHGLKLAAEQDLLVPKA